MYIITTKKRVRNTANFICDNPTLLKSSPV